MRKVYILPNLFTTGNLFCGFLALTFILTGKAQAALFSIFIAILLDGLDGKIARATKSFSSFGLNYDSLADLVSFGAVPALLVYQLTKNSHNKIALAGSALYIICAALRLARFNVQAKYEESKNFLGLPTPASAGLLLSLILFYQKYKWQFVFRSLPFVSVILACLMVSKIPYFNLKQAQLNRKKPFNYLVSAVLILGILIIFLEFFTILLLVIFLGYTLLGIAFSLRIPVWKVPILSRYILPPHGYKAAMEKNVSKENPLGSDIP